ncbi:MAG: hypothetical protein ACYSUZ_02515 [Planctomycetota bacterium]
MKKMYRKFDLHKLINRITARCESLELYASDDLKELIGVTAFLATIACGTGRNISQGRI